MSTHDYRGPSRCWGHDYTFTPRTDTAPASMVGWGEGIEEGDFFLLDNGYSQDGYPLSTRYQVDEIHYYRDPKDMWRATVSFAPQEA